MPRFQLGVIVTLTLIGTGLALECYTCDTEDDGNKCKEKDPKTDKLDRYISDDKDTCYVCYKATYDDDGKQTARGCAGKDLYDSFDAKKDKCSSGSFLGSDADVCICDEDKCNGSGNVMVSMATLLLTMASTVLF